MANLGKQKNGKTKKAESRKAGRFSGFFVFVLMCPVISGKIDGQAI